MFPTGRFIGAILASALLASPLAAQWSPGPRRPSAPPPAAPGTNPVPKTPAGPVFTPADTLRTTTVSGIVYDSLSRMPLAGATVQLVEATARARLYDATTDSTGQFRVSIRPGRYLAGFFHPSLETLGLDLPPRLFAIGPDGGRVELSIPGPTAVIGAICKGRQTDDSASALIGQVRDADSGMPINNAKVVLTWNELRLEPTGLNTVRRRVPAASRAGGLFTVCNLPSNTPMIASAEAPGRESGYIQVSIPAGGILHRDFLLGDSTNAVAFVPDTQPGGVRGPKVRRGTAALTGTVKTKDGRPVDNARLVVWGTAATGKTNSNGAFSLSGLPAGTFSIEARAVGYEPQQLAVDLTSRHASVANIVMSAKANELPSVVVNSQRRTPRTGLDEFDDRKQHGGFGHYLDASDIMKFQPITITDALRTTPGLHVVPSGSQGYTIVGRDGTCAPTVYLDGMKVSDGATDLDSFVRPKDVHGIEYYAGSLGAPAEYQGNSCGTVLVWTKR